MNNEDKRLIADYMGWEIRLQDWWRPENDSHGLLRVNFNLNDAGACVKEMDKRGDLDDFGSNALMMCFKVTKIDIWPTNFFAWLYDADNFFEVMAKWLKEEENG